MSQPSNKLKRKTIIDEMWLHYYNDALLKRGLITETIHRKMKLEINLRTQRLMNKRKE